MNAPASPICWLNGRFLPLAEASIPVLDRGFIFGDGVYEVIPVYGRQPFRLAEHLARLARSLAAVRITNPHDDAMWTALIAELVARQDFADQSVYIQVTRGVAKRDHAFPKDTVPTVFMMSNPLVTPPAALVDSGVAAITATDNRWLRCDVKATALLANVLLKQLAVDAGAAEVVLLRDGPDAAAPRRLTEGSSSNIFVVRDGAIATPKRDHFVLPGITLDVVAELARTAGIPFDERDITEAEVRAADELWLASSTREVLAITSLDGRPVGIGMPGPMYRRMITLFQQHRSERRP